MKSIKEKCMKIKALIAASACVALLAGCTNNPYTGEREAG